jgi:transposase
MPQNFLRADADQGFLLPPDVRDWLPEDDLAWCVRDVVDTMDLTVFYSAYRGNGQGGAAFDPAVMVAVLVYAHAVGVRSSRAMERACQRDVAFRVLTGNLTPDHATIARFFRRHRSALEALFAQVLGLCHAAGMVALGQIAIDGTKIAANASWSANYTEAALEHQVAEQQAAFAALAAGLLDEQAGLDAAEDDAFATARGDELPAPLRSSARRLARLRDARDRLAEEREAAVAEQEAKKAAWQARKDTGARTGRRPADTPPRPASGKAPRANTTDPDSRAMRCQHTLVQGYNAQAAVTDTQVIVGALLTQHPVDQNLLHPVLETTHAQVSAAGLDPAALSTVLADAGYASEDTFARAETAGLHLLAPLVRDERRTAGSDPAAGRDLTRYPATARAQAKLRTVQGRCHYAQRGRTVEPVFGQIKDRQQLRRFSHRGLDNVTTEWIFACTVHNIRKLHQHRLTHH